MVILETQSIEDFEVVVFVCVIGEEKPRNRQSFPEVRKEVEGNKNIPFLVGPTAPIQSIRTLHKWREMYKNALAFNDP